MENRAFEGFEWRNDMTCDFKKLMLSTMLEIDYKEAKQKQADQLGNYHKYAGEAIRQAGRKLLDSEWDLVIDGW